MLLLLLAERALNPGSAAKYKHTHIYTHRRKTEGGYKIGREKNHGHRQDKIRLKVLKALDVTVTAWIPKKIQKYVLS